MTNEIKTFSLLAAAAVLLWACTAGSSGWRDFRAECVAGKMANGYTSSGFAQVSCEKEWEAR